jgi:predicted ATPase/DNA-binding CsgD family transcriptional regulator
VQELADRHHSSSGDLPSPSPGLPVQLTTFIGRQAERGEVTRLLAGARLLTLTGPGGVGKTRLALEVAGRLVTEYPDGVWLVELAALADGTLVPQAVAAALRVAEVPGQPLRATLSAALRTRRLLILLDNCEHLVGACAELADRLLRECPALRILATSREPLGIPGETIWPVPPLPVPDQRVVMGTDEIGASAAVSLFVDRAHLVLPTFVLGDRNAQVVAEICRRLDGIPLAIELAAARLRSLGVVEIAERLDDRFRFLTTELRTIVPRQQTLRATVDWSYELLEDPERRLLRALAVFAGGWSLEAIEGVGCWVSDVGGSSTPSPNTQNPEPETLEVLAHLVDRSLVLADSQHGRARYRLLETIRQYGLEKLRERGEEPALRARHCDWFLALAERAGPALRGPDQAAWVERLELEHDNLRAALGWAVEVGDAERGLRMARALWRFWSYRGYLTEGRRWLDAVLALATTAKRSAMLAEVLFAAGRMLHQQGEYASANQLFQASLAMAEAVGHGEGVVGALTQLGHLAFNNADYCAARDRYTQALAHRHTAGDSGEVVVALASLAFVSQIQGEYDDSRRLYEEGLTIVERLGDRSLRAYLMCRLGELDLDLGHYAEARARFTAGLQIYQLLGARTRLAGVLEGFAMLAAAHDQASRAMRLAGAAAALRDIVTARPTPRESAWLRSGLERVRRQLGDRASDEVWAVGLAMPLDQAIAEALDERAGPLDLVQHDRPADQTTWATPGHPLSLTPGTMPGAMPLAEVLDGALFEPLTERQREVAELVALGLTNRQIGEALVITEGTANLHVKHILRKLGFATRAQIATWVTQQGRFDPSPIVSERR